MGAIGSIAFAFNTVILPELQVSLVHHFVMCCAVLRCAALCCTSLQPLCCAVLGCAVLSHTQSLLDREDQSLDSCATFDSTVVRVCPIVCDLHTLKQQPAHAERHLSCFDSACYCRPQYDHQWCGTSTTLCCPSPTLSDASLGSSCPLLVSPLDHPVLCW